MGAVAPLIENRKVPLSYKRPNPTSQYKKQSIYTGGTEIFSCVKIRTQDLLKVQRYYIIQKEMKNITFMKKYTDSKVPITIDPISNEYKITIPEWVVNEFDWYEDTELVWVVDDQGIHIQEVSE